MRLRVPGPRTGPLRSWMLLVGILAWSACDGGGPGTILVTVDAPEALGAVTLDVVGAGVRGFEAVGATRAFGSVVSSRQGRHRVVLVAPSGEVLRVGIRLDDLRGTWPTVRVVSAAGTDDVERVTAGIDIRVERR